MGVSFFFEWEVKLMEAVQHVLGAWSTPLAAFLSILGEQTVMVGVVGLLYWCLNKKAGKTVAFQVMVASTVNAFLKNIVTRRRPYMDHAGIECRRAVEKGADLLDVNAQGYSFPSGHSTNAAALYGAVALYFRTHVLTVLWILMMVLVGFSRILLGVHYPTDVAAGLAGGTALTVLLDYLRRKGVSLESMELAAVLLLVPGWFFCTSNDYFTSYGLLVGMALGFEVEKRYVNFKETRMPLEILLRMAGGTVIYLGLNEVLKMPFSKEFLECGSTAAHFVRTLRYALVAFVLTAVYPMAFPLLRKKRRG